MVTAEACTCIRVMRYVLLHFCAPTLVFATDIEDVQEEQDRMDLYHKIMEVARRGHLHSAPIYSTTQDPLRILDVGCGTGIWAIDMAE
jgi:ubiquinone/menaquinone biosynthesis C-methylase UbiE